jgi:hypothetical protein
MNLNSNNQESIAEQVVLNEIYNNHAAYEAILKIKRWKFIMQIPGVAQKIAKEADESIQKNFLTFVSNQYVLAEEDNSYASIYN